MDAASRKYWKTPLSSVAEMLEAFEDMPDDIELPDDIFVEPPEFTNDTDEDSGEEEDFDPNRFSKNQLLAGVEVQFRNEILDLVDENTPEEVDPIAESKPHRRINQKWVAGNEDDFNLSANMYRFDTWDGTRIYPLTLSAESQAIDFFYLFFDPSFLNSVVEHTRNYAAKKKNKSINIELDDMYAFIGVMIVSGYNVLPRRRMYWTKDSDARNELVSNWMRRPMFEEIFTNIHFCDIETIQDKTDRFAKIRPFIKHLNEVFLQYAPIQMNISVDESMIPYYGRHPCKQFIRNKPIRFGYKAWVAASRLGYCYSFDVYQGRNQKRDNNLGLGESVVLNFAKQLRERFPQMHFALYFDNFFTGPNLLSFLNDMMFAGTGTVRENRLKNIQLREKKLLNNKPRGYFENYVDVENNLVLTRWKDNQTVSLLSNCFGQNPVGTARRYVHTEKQKIDVPQPAAVKMYNRNMGGVDIMDRHVSNYRMNIRGKKFYMPIVLWMFDLAVTNAWSLAKAYNVKCDQLEFRRQLAVALLTRHGKSPSKGKTTKKPAVLCSGAHTSERREKRMRCKHCQSQTIYFCTSCSIPLHSNCSAEFHRLLN